jgi:hypothetical protein
MAHVGGVPVEETIAAFSPALLIAFRVTWWRARRRHVDATAAGQRRPVA